MRDFLTITLILTAGAIVSTAPFLPAQSVQHHFASIARKKAGGGAAPTYLLEEDMEGTGTPSGWSDTNSPNWDDSTNNIIGTYSWSAGATNINSTSPTFTAPSTCYCFFALTVGTASGNVKLFRLRNNTSGEQGSFEYRSSGAFRISHGSATSTTSVSSGTYYVWLEYTAGTGSDGTLDAYWAATQTKPGAANLSITTGTSTIDIDEIGLNGHGNTSVFDKIRVDDVSIGSTPD